MFKRVMGLCILMMFVISSVCPNTSYAQALNLPPADTVVGTSMAFTPVILKGLQIKPENPMLFDFIVDTGDTGLNVDKDDAAIREESQKLIKYFLASLALPEEDQWVNLSPYEKDRMLPAGLEKTELGRDMLAQDYMLKQVTSSLIYPEKGLGKQFWARVYAQVRQKFGNVDVSVDTFNKVWVVADEADVYVHDNAAFVVGSHLKVMLEQDYLATQEASRGGSQTRPASQDAFVAKELVKQVVREIVLPALETEVNNGKNFANLRQIFHSMILAAWYKQNLKKALINQVYSNKAKTDGVQRGATSLDPQAIYARYVEAYRKGVFNFIKEDATPDGGFMPRKYFSGGLQFAVPAVLRPAGLEGARNFAMKSGLRVSVRLQTVRSSEAGLLRKEDGVRVRRDLAMRSEDAGSDDEELSDYYHASINRLRSVASYFSRVQAGDPGAVREAERARLDWDAMASWPLKVNEVKSGFYVRPVFILSSPEGEEYLAVPADDLGDQQDLSLCGLMLWDLSTRKEIFRGIIPGQFQYGESWSHIAHRVAESRREGTAFGYDLNPEGSKIRLADGKTYNGSVIAERLFAIRQAQSKGGLRRDGFIQLYRGYGRLRQRAKFSTEHQQSLELVDALVKQDLLSGSEVMSVSETAEGKPIADYDLVVENGILGLKPCDGRKDIVREEKARIKIRMWLHKKSVEVPNFEDDHSVDKVKDVTLARWRDIEYLTNAVSGRAPDVELKLSLQSRGEKVVSIQDIDTLPDQAWVIVPGGITLGKDINAMPSDQKRHLRRLEIALVNGGRVYVVKDHKFSGVGVVYISRREQEFKALIKERGADLLDALQRDGFAVVRQDTGTEVSRLLKDKEFNRAVQSKMLEGTLDMPSNWEMEDLVELGPEGLLTTYQLQDCLEINYFDTESGSQPLRRELVYPEKQIDFYIDEMHKYFTFAALLTPDQFKDRLDAETGVEFEEATEIKNARPGDVPGGLLMTQEGFVPNGKFDEALIHGGRLIRARKGDLYVSFLLTDPSKRDNQARRDFW